MTTAESMLTLMIRALEIRRGIRGFTSSPFFIVVETLEVVVGVAVARNPEPYAASPNPRLKSQPKSPNPTPKSPNCRNPTTPFHDNRFKSPEPYNLLPSRVGAVGALLTHTQ